MIKQDIVPAVDLLVSKKIQKNKRTFCSKCGKMLLQDRYNYKKHEYKCHANFYNIDNPLMEKDCFGYSVHREGDRLIFTGYRLNLTESKVYNNKFSGSEWKEIYQAVFSRNSKETEEEGVFSADIWFRKLIDDCEIPSLVSDPLRIISDAFPCIYKIYSFGMFLDIYRQKGYHVADIKAETLDKNGEIMQILKKNNISYPTSFPVVSITRSDDDVLIRLDLPGSRIPVYIGKDIVICHNHDALDQFLSDYPSTDFNREQKITYIDSNGNISFHSDNNVIREFSLRYPELMIDKYLTSGKYPISYILSLNTNKNRELAGKAGLGYFCDFYDLLEIPATTATSLQEIFGMPLRALRCLNSFDGIDFMISFRERDIQFNFRGKQTRIQKAQDVICIFYEIVPDIFDKVFTKGLLEFMKLFIYRTHLLIDSLSPREILKIMRYIQNHQEFMYPAASLLAQLYVDYLLICRNLGKYAYGLCPKDIKQAHDHALEIYKMKLDKIMYENFAKNVSERDYVSLESRDEEKFIIVAPKEPSDLVRESDALHHCVHTYVDMVAGGHTKIYFLRRKENPETPFCTIEVVQNCIMQLKASCNHPAPEDVMEFVKKWANDKNLVIYGTDIK